MQLVDVHTRANDNCSDDVAMLELNAVNGASNDEEALIGDVQEGEEEVREIKRCKCYPLAALSVP